MQPRLAAQQEVEAVDLGKGQRSAPGQLMVRRDADKGLFPEELPDLGVRLRGGRKGEDGDVAGVFLLTEAAECRILLAWV